MQKTDSAAQIYKATDGVNLGLPNVLELTSGVPGWVTFVPEFTDSSSNCFGATFWGSVLPILAKIAQEIEDRFYVKTPFFVFSDIASFQRKIIKSGIDFK